MSTSSPMKPPMPPNAPGIRAAAAPTQGSSPSMATIDPVRLLKKYKWLLLASIVAGAMFGVVAHFALLQVYPVFRSAAVFLIEPPRDEFGRLPEARNVDEEELKRFMLTQVAVMTSPQVLQRVCERLNQNSALAPKWRRGFESGGAFKVQDAMIELEKIASARVIPGTQLVELAVWYQDAADATALAELMRREYLTLLQVREQSVNGELKGQFDAQLNNQNERIRTLQNERDQLVRGVGEAGSAGQAMESIDGRYNASMQQMQLVMAQLQQTNQALDLFGVQVAQMMAAKEAPGGVAYSDEIRAIVETNGLVANARAIVDAIQTEIRVMRERQVGENHPEMVSLRTRLRAAEQNLADIRERELLMTFNGRLDQMQTTINSYLQLRESLESQRAELSLRLQDLLASSRRIVDLETQIERLITARSETQGKLENLEAFIRQSTRAPDMGMGRVRVLATERKPDEVVFPRLRIVGPAGVVLIVGLVGGIVFMRELMDQRVKSPQDIGLIPRTRVVGIIPLASEDPTSPKRVELAFRDKPKGVIAEYFRQIRAPLAKKMAQSDARALLIVPGMPGSGATTIVSNLGHAFAALEKRTLVIDANMRRPALHKVFDLPEGPGLGEVLAGKTSLEQAVRETTAANLSVLSVGGAEDRVYERLATASMAALLAEARSRYDVVLIDVAPAMVAGDATALAAHCDASILVVRAMAEKRGLVARLRNELADTRGEFLGVIVNAVRSAAGGYIRKNIQATHGYQAAA